LQFSRDEAGNVMMMFVISLVAIVAMVGATLALSMDSKSANELQHTADGAALGGAVAFIKAQSPKLEDRKKIALEQAEILANQNSDTVIVKLDAVAASEDEYGQYMTMQVDASFKPTNAAASMVGRNANVEVSSRAVADATWGFPLCVLALSETGSGFSTDNQATFESRNCIVWSNSDDSRSMNFTGGSATAKAMCAAGGVYGGMRARPSPASQCRKLKDPLEAWVPPTAGKCPSVATTPSVDTSKLADDFDALLKFPFDLVQFNEEYNKLMLAIIYLHNGGWQANGVGDIERVARASAEIAAIETELDPFLNLNQYLRNHPYFNLSNNSLTSAGLLTSGEGKGMTLSEVAQLLGLLDNLDPADYADDNYSTAPTTILNPGTFCGLDISEGHVKLNPGTYFIKDGPLTVRRRATLSGDGVTIVMSGQDAYFGIMDEARLDIRAPSSGDLAGFALVEDKSRNYSGASQVLKHLPQLTNSPRPISKLTGAGEVSAVGTVYLPRHDFTVTGDGAGQQTSPLLQIVANTVSLSDNGQISIDFDEHKAQVPAGIKAERSARLIE
jgi:Flp pilus assembly protein TadG